MVGHFQARISCIRVFAVSTFPTMVAQQLRKEAAEVEKALEELRQSNADAESTMKDIRDAWKERLENIVERLNSRFGG